MYLNIAIVNNSGNVGKSTICETMLKPRIPNAEVIKVETINSDGTDDAKFSADEFDSILKQMDATDCSIIDVGSSNIESFLLKMQEYKGSEEDIDYFIIPVIPKHKQQIDAVTTANMLLDMGVEPECIKFIFNMSDKKLSIERQYPDFLNGIQMLDIVIDSHSIIYESSVFSMLNNLDRKFIDVVSDNRDFKKLLRSSESREQREALSEQRSVKRLVNGVNDEMDIAFKALGILDG
ncbi:transcriptional regulator [Vibrio cyclitrophicus 1F175]|uniref:StbB family protein n=1 Tax=Vibrio cyclitrophicus TaxID=47951 RepID=UPI0002F3BBCB|nr:StbB family protein [Vibrio cyclitrophicus]OEF62204.1 transcriptional regulator [Vibrio cyclitrophicus 1F175]